MACISTLLDISTSCGSNLASIKKLWIGAFESADFTFNYQKDAGDNYVLDADGNKIIESVATGALKAETTDTWKVFGFKKNTSEMTSEMTRNDNGSYYFSNGANLVFAKQDAVKRLALQATASGECSMIVLDSNGIYWLIGYENAATANTLTATTGVAVGDANQYSITISADEAYMPIPVDSEAAEGIIANLTGASN